MIGCIVEGHGDRDALPVLIRRIAALTRPDITVTVARPIRIPKSRLVQPGELERAVELTARKISNRGGIVILVDADDDCPAFAGPILYRRASGTRSDLPIAVVLAKREFESWFIAAADSLRSYRGLRPDLESPRDAESIVGAEEWLARRMSTGKYVETLDQPALASQFDIASARRADSFDKFYREVLRLLDVCSAS